MKPNSIYTYEQAGFNAFMLRSLKSNATAMTLKNGISVGSGKPVNFDLQAISGQIGDMLKVGLVNINGVRGRVETQNEQGVDTGWIGNITP